jgi:hypothetical protein
VGGEAPVTPVSSPDSSFGTFPTNRAITPLFPHLLGFRALLTQEGLVPHFMGRGVDRPRGR